MHEKKTSIVLGITGSIAAYKAIELAKKLNDSRFDVDIVLTSSASTFISLLTLRSLFPKKFHFLEDLMEESDEMTHITLAKKADYILIAPCSANFIAKLACGIADDLLSSLCLATTSPIILAPAMNKTMWENPFVQKNCETLRRAHITLIGPESGLQACGDIGPGRMLEVDKILDYMEYVTTPKTLQGKKIVITAGPTHEKWDPVRFIGNYSSGKMGYALAKEARNRGAEIVLISGPTHLPAIDNITLLAVETAQEILEAVKSVMQGADIFIGAAAVADYRPLTPSSQKTKKGSQTYQLELTQNEDIITYVKQCYPLVFCMGFSAETTNCEAHGFSKLQKKNLDMIVINDVSEGKVFGKDENEALIILKNGEKHIIKRMTKDKMAALVLNCLSDQLK